MSWIDLLIVFVFIFSILSGVSRGLIASLATLVSFVISVIFANTYFEELGDFLMSNTGLLENIKSLIPIGFNEGIGVGANVENLPDGATSYITQSLVEGESVLAEGLGNAMAEGIVYIISFLLLFMLIRFVLRFFIKGIDSIFKLPLLNFFNKVGGGVIGIIRGVLSNWIIVSIIYTIALLGIEGDLANEINNSVLASYFYIGYLFY